MFPYPIATLQGCNIQTFYGVNLDLRQQIFTWNKPVGVSHVYMMLIGAGGYSTVGDTNGGGSGAVTVWYGAAQHVPDSLFIFPGSGVGGATNNTTVYYRGSTPVTLLTANGANALTGGTASAQPPFGASGFYQSVAGQDGGTSNPGPSPTTFLNAGNGGTVTANYGYAFDVNKAGYFQMRPIIVGSGGTGTNGSDGAIGCGAGGYGGKGGPGMVLIASW